MSFAQETPAIVFSGKTEEEALESALEELSLTKDDIVYEAKEQKRDIKVQEALPLDEVMNTKSKVEERLESINPLEITPLEALNILYELKNINK